MNSLWASQPDIFLCNSRSISVMVFNPILKYWVCYYKINFENGFSLYFRYLWAKAMGVDMQIGGKGEKGSLADGISVPCTYFCGRYANGLRANSGRGDPEHFRTYALLSAGPLL